MNAVGRPEARDAAMLRRLSAMERRVDRGWSRDQAGDTFVVENEAEALWLRMIIVRFYPSLDRLISIGIRR